MKLKFLTGDVNYKQYGAKWISKKFNNGDFDYWLVVELINMIDATGDDNQYTYNISISSIAPSEVTEDHLNSAISCCGWNKTDNLTNEEKVLVLSDYGISAHLWNQSGNNFKKLWKEAHNQLIAINMLFGFYMDSPKNMLGDTGWDLIKGDIGVNKLCL